jgi:hypothetical protein
VIKRIVIKYKILFKKYLNKTNDQMLLQKSTVILI